MKYIFLFFIFIANLSFGQNLYDYYLIKGQEYEMRGDPEKSIFYFNKAIERYPDSADCYFFRAKTYYFSDQPEEALSDLNKAFELNPDKFVIHELRGKVQEDLRLFIEAEEDYKIYLRRFPDSEFSRRGLARVHIGLKKYNLAEKELRQLLASTENKADVHDILGYLYLLKKEFEKSLIELDLTIELDPENASAYYKRAQVHDHLEHHEQACSDWKTAYNMGIEDANIFYDGNNCKGVKGLGAEDKNYDKKEQQRKREDSPQEVIFTPDYFPMDHGQSLFYTQTTPFKWTTREVSIKADTLNSNQVLCRLDPELTVTPNFYFEMLGFNGIIKSSEHLILGQTYFFDSDYAEVTQLIDTLRQGEDIRFENLRAQYIPHLSTIEYYLLQYIGFEDLDIDNNTIRNCLKIRVLEKDRTGKDFVQYYWFAKDIGLVQWRKRNGTFERLSHYGNKVVLPPTIIQEEKTIHIENH